MVDNGAEHSFLVRCCFITEAMLPMLANTSKTYSAESTSLPHTCPHSSSTPLVHLDITLPTQLVACVTSVCFRSNETRLSDSDKSLSRWSPTLPEFLPLPLSSLYVCPACLSCLSPSLPRCQLMERRLPPGTRKPAWKTPSKSRWVETFRCRLGDNHLHVSSYCRVFPNCNQHKPTADIVHPCHRAPAELM